MKIYTKTGDAGQTSLSGRKRVSKSDVRVRAYGALDELNAVLGWAFVSDSWTKWIQPIQETLFRIGAELATPPEEECSLAVIQMDASEILEKKMDEWSSGLLPLKNFILPGGGEVAARIHFARTISRRAEREVIELHETQGVRKEVLIYLNRLSDWLFIAARKANQDQKISDVEWNPSVS